MRQPYRNHSNEKEKKFNKNVFNFQLEDRLILIFISKQDLFTISVVLVLHCKNSFYKEVIIPFRIKVIQTEVLVFIKLYLNHRYSGRYRDFFIKTDHLNIYQNCFYSVLVLYSTSYGEIISQLNISYIQINCRYYFCIFTLYNYYKQNYQ